MTSRALPSQRIDIDVRLGAVRVSQIFNTGAVHVPNKAVVFGACVALGGGNLKNHAHVPDAILDLVGFLLWDAKGRAWSHSESVDGVDEEAHAFGEPETGLAIGAAGDLKKNVFKLWNFWVTY